MKRSMSSVLWWCAVPAACPAANSACLATSQTRPQAKESACVNSMDARADGDRSLLQPSHLHSNRLVQEKNSSHHVATRSKCFWRFSAADRVNREFGQEEIPVLGVTGAPVMLGHIGPGQHLLPPPDVQHMHSSMLLQTEVHGLRVKLDSMHHTQNNLGSLVCGAARRPLGG